MFFQIPPLAPKRADSRLAPSQWETALLCNDVSHWVGASPESALQYTLIAQLVTNLSMGTLVYDVQDLTQLLDYYIKIATWYAKRYYLWTHFGTNMHAHIPLTVCHDMPLLMWFGTGYLYLNPTSLSHGHICLDNHIYIYIYIYTAVSVRMKKRDKPCGSINERGKQTKISLGYTWWRYGMENLCCCCCCCFCCCCYTGIPL